MCWVKICLIGAMSYAYCFGNISPELNGGAWVSLEVSGMELRRRLGAETPAGPPADGDDICPLS